MLPRRLNDNRSYTAAAGSPVLPVKCGAPLLPSRCRGCGSSGSAAGTPKGTQPFGCRDRLPAPSIQSNEDIRPTTSHPFFQKKKNLPGKPVLSARHAVRKRPTGRAINRLPRRSALTIILPVVYTPLSVSHMIHYIKDITNRHDCQADKSHHFRSNIIAFFVYPIYIIGITVKPPEKFTKIVL